MHHDRPIAGRFRLLRLLPGKGGKGATFLALDERTSQSVVCAVLPIVRVAGLQGAIGLEHPRLARVLEVIHDFDPLDVPPEVEGAADGSIVIAEWLPGRTLHQRLKSAPLPAYRAVEYTAHVATAVMRLHERASVHGALSPRCVILERADQGPVPAVSLCVAPPDGSCFSPERAGGSGPSAWDDVWALHVILYAALTGSRPFTGSSARKLARAIAHGTPSPLAVYDAGDDDLQEIIDRGFCTALARRTSRADDLIADLAMWMARNRSRANEQLDPEQEEPHVDLDGTEEEASSLDSSSLVAQRQLAMETGSWWPPGDSELPAAANDPSNVSNISDLQPPAAEPSAPEPEPERAQEHESPSPAAATPSRAIAKKRSSRLPVSGAVALAAAAAVVVAVGLRARSFHEAAAPPRAPSPPAKLELHSGAPEVPPSPSGSAAASAAVTSSAATSAAVAPEQDVSACVAGLMPKDTFALPQDFSFLCDEPDVRKGLPRVRSRIVAGGRGALTAGANEWSRFGWYELAVYGVMRAACCPEAAPVQLPDSIPPCPSLGPLVEHVARAVAARSADTDLHVQDFERAATCVHGHGSVPYSYESGPLGGGQIGFGAFIKRALNRP